jgi:hypothetical protein
MVTNAIITGTGLGLEFFNLFEIYSSDVFFLSSIVPAVACGNTDTMKQDIIKDNNKKVGIYLWTHNESGKRYIGSAFDLFKRFRSYYSISYLNRTKSMYICRALLHHGYSAFSLAIIEYIDITNLSFGGPKELILEKEQYHLDKSLSEYNILKVAGSLLGFIHSADTERYPPRRGRYYC